MKTRQRHFAIALAILPLWMYVSLLGNTGTGTKSLVEVASTQFRPGFALAAAFLALAQFVVQWPGFGLNGPRPPRSLLLLWLPFLYLCIMFGVAAAAHVPFEAIGFIALNCLFVGISEELMFRGILFSAVRDRFSLWIAIWLTSIVFGALHTLNGFITGDWFASSVQAVAAFMGGVSFAAMRVRTGSLLVCIVMHALWDAGAFLVLMAAKTQQPAGAAPAQPVGAALWFGVLLVLPLFLYALYLLRGVPRSGAAQTAAA